MIYSYPFFSFPHFRRYPNYYSYGSVAEQNNIAPYSNKPNGRDYNLKTRTENIAEYYSDRDRDRDRNRQRSNINVEECKVNNEKEKSTKKTPPGFNFLSSILHQEDRDEDESYFELFGIKLYHDDLLLLSLIFFLYKEDIKDQYLFFALILLLLS